MTFKAVSDDFTRHTDMISAWLSWFLQEKESNYFCKKEWDWHKQATIQSKQCRCLFGIRTLQKDTYGVLKPDEHNDNNGSPKGFYSNLRSPQGKTCSKSMRVEISVETKSEQKEGCGLNNSSTPRLYVCRACGVLVRVGSRGFDSGDRNALLRGFLWQPVLKSILTCILLRGDGGLWPVGLLGWC